MNRVCRISIAGMVALFLLATVAPGSAAPRVEVNGVPVSFTAAPIQLNDTILVPMRDICQALGAQVSWQASTQTATATRGTTNVRLTIGEDTAWVDGRSVALDVPAMYFRGSTMVPLAFISKALGADVRWSDATQTASIYTSGVTSYDNEWAQVTRSIELPRGTVVPVTLDTGLDPLSSDATGEFRATVRSNWDGDAEFPRGTRFVGTVAGLRRSESRETRSRTVRFREAQLTDGTKVPINGLLIALEDSTVTRSMDGRLVATEETLRGVARPYGIAFSQSTQFGVLINRDVKYEAPAEFVTARSAYLSSGTADNDESWNGGLWTGVQTVVIPSTTVVPVSLDSQLSSATSRVGDGFSATVVSTLDGDAEFPRGTKLVGNIVGLQRAGGGKPGVLDLAFSEAWLPDGSKATIYGSLISLDDKSVTRATDGRLRARVTPADDDRLKFIGIGAGAGLVIGKLLDQNLIVGGLLGAAAGYFYNEYKTDKVKPTDVVVKSGTVFGVRMDRDVSYSASSTFAGARNTYFASGALSSDQYPNYAQWTDMQTVVVPEATVVPVNLDGQLGSLTGKVGDGFSVTVQSSQNGDNEFPRGTRLLGTIVDVQRAGAGKPGVLDVDFREAWLPDGSRAPLEGSVISLDDKTVTRTADGRLKATVKATKDNRLKFIGIGAGAGLLIGKLLDQNLIVGGLLGAAAGYFYNEYKTEKVEPKDVVLNAGTVFGVRMDRDVTYTAPASFVAARNAYLNAP